jgi:hypothetical protein
MSAASILDLRPTQPPIQWVTEVLSPGVKQAEHETDHSSPCVAKTENTWPQNIIKILFFLTSYNYKCCKEVEAATMHDMNAGRKGKRGICPFLMNSRKN